MIATRTSIIGVPIVGIAGGSTALIRDCEGEEMSELTHATNCAGLTPDRSDECTCGLKHRIVIEQQAARIAALEAEVELHANNCTEFIKANWDLEEKLAAANALIEQCKEAMTWEIGGEPLPTLMIAALTAIERYQKGEQ